jgi:hypothetical protein
MVRAAAQTMTVIGASPVALRLLTFVLKARPGALRSRSHTEMRRPDTLR